MGALLALLFQKKEPRKPVSFGGGCLNALKNNGRGLVATALVIIIFGVFCRVEKESSHNLTAIWLSLFVFTLIQPMAVGASALMPVFAVPILGVLQTSKVCGALSNENIVMFYLGGWLLMLLNNCGLDKRLVCWFLDQGAYTPHKLLIKSCFAAFCISAIGEREMVSQKTMNYVVAALGPLKGVKEADFQELSLILCNAIAVSSLLGSMCIVHASINTIQMRALFYESGTATAELPDIFNYLNYSAYAIPTVLVMFLLNLLYEALLVSKLAAHKPLTAHSKDLLKKAFKKNRQDLGPMTNHEKVSAGFLVLILLCFFTRWSKWLHYGWATFRHYEGTDISAVSDATTAAIFAVLLHYLPKSLHFFKICFANSAGSILYKGMVKTKLNESIYYLFGWKLTSLPWNLGILLVVSSSVGLGTIMSGVAAQACYMPLMLGVVGIREKITSLPWNVGISLVVLIPVFLGSIMSTLATQTCFMPLMLVMAMTGKEKWPQRSYLVALGVGLGTGLGFSSPFPNHPSYWVPVVGKVPRKKQYMYSIGSEIICCVILWLSLCFFAPLLWDPDDLGIIPQLIPGLGGAPVATVAPEAGAEPPAGR